MSAPMKGSMVQRPSKSKNAASRNHNILENEASKSGNAKKFDLETESKFINKNLTTLGRIFSILSNRKL